MCACVICRFMKAISVMWRIRAIKGPWHRTWAINLKVNRLIRVWLLKKRYRPSSAGAKD